MCGRFASYTPASQLQQWYDALVFPEIAPRYNIAPGTSIAVVRDSADGREGLLMRWGFIPAWAKDPASVPMLNNARGETVAEKPMFRQAFRKRRCLIPASGFYEWKAVPGQRSKQPFFISFNDGTPMSFAGIWETSRGPDGSPLDTCTILTTEANDVLAPIHHRMPVIIDQDDWAAWLDPRQAAETALLKLVKPFAPERMQAWGVAHAVNKAINDDPSLLQPIA